MALNLKRSFHNEHASCEHHTYARLSNTDKCSTYCCLHPYMSSTFVLSFFAPVVWHYLARREKRNVACLPKFMFYRRHDQAPWWNTNRRHATQNTLRDASHIFSSIAKIWSFSCKAKYARLRTLLLDFPASIVSRASSATETPTRLTNLTIRAGSLPKPLSASFGYLKEQTFPTKRIKLYHIFRFSTIPNTFKKMAVLNWTY